MNYLTLLPFDLRRYFYCNYLIVKKELNAYWSMLPAFTSCKEPRSAQSSRIDKALSFSYFVKYGYLDQMIWAHSKGWPHDKEVVYLATVSGHLDVLKWLRNNTSDVITNENMIYAATEAGHADILQYLIEQDCIYEAVTIITRAINCKHLQILQLIHEKKNDKRYNSLFKALSSSHILAVVYNSENIIIWLLRQHYCTKSEIKLLAAGLNMSNILQLLDTMTDVK